MILSPLAQGRDLFIKRKREPTMPRRSLKVLRKPVSRCNNSSPRYTCENHYALPCSVYEFLRFSNYKISITLLIFQNVVDSQRIIR